MPLGQFYFCFLSQVLKGSLGHVGNCSVIMCSHTTLKMADPRQKPAWRRDGLAADSSRNRRGNWSRSRVERRGQKVSGQFVSLGLWGYACRSPGEVASIPLTSASRQIQRLIYSVREVLFAGNKPIVTIRTADTPPMNYVSS